MIAIARLGALVLGIVLAAAGAASAEGKLVTVASLTGASAELQLAEYTTENGQKVGLVAMKPKAGGTRVAFAFGAGQTQQLRTALAATRDLHGPGRKVAGVVSETGTTNQCVLVIHGGASLQITLVDPEEGEAVVYAPSASELGDIMAAVDRISAFLASP